METTRPPLEAGMCGQNLHKSPANLLARPGMEWRTGAGTRTGSTARVLVSSPSIAVTRAKPGIKNQNHDRQNRRGVDVRPCASTAAATPAG